MGQLLLVGLVVAASAVYAGWRFYEAIRQTDDPCKGCQGCALREEKRKIEARKKNCEKFGRTK